MTVFVKPITEKRTIIQEKEVGKAYTVTLSEREVAMLYAYLAHSNGSVGSRLYRELRDALPYHVRNDAAARGLGPNTRRTLLDLHGSDLNTYLSTLSDRIE